MFDINEVLAVKILLVKILRNKFYFFYARKHRTKSAELFVYNRQFTALDDHQMKWGRNRNGFEASLSPAFT